jgi:hypothetical protein
MVNAAMTALASSLGALEGPVTCQDGSVVVTSIDQGQVYRILDGQPKVLAVTGGGPHGATEGLDGTSYISQNGGAPPALNIRRMPPAPSPSLEVAASSCSARE